MPSFPLLYSLYIYAFYLIQPLSEADYICQTLQVDFDSMLCNILGKDHSFPGFTVLLGGLCQYVSTKEPYTLGPGIVASSYLIRRWEEGHILHETGLFGTYALLSHIQDIYSLLGTPEFFSYFTGFLEDPKRSGPCFFDQQRYAMAAKECLQLYLCSRHNFSKGATEFALHDRTLRRSKPLAWLARLGVHSRIRKARHHFKVRQYKSLKARTHISQHSSFPKSSPQYQYYRSLSYKWTLDLLPFLLERSAISLELADVLRRCTFTMMAWKFPRRRRLAKEAITKYFLRVGRARHELHLQTGGKRLFPLVLL